MIDGLYIYSLLLVRATALQIRLVLDLLGVARARFPKPVKASKEFQSGSVQVVGRYDLIIHNALNAYVTLIACPHC